MMRYKNHRLLAFLLNNYQNSWPLIFLIFLKRQMNNLFVKDKQKKWESHTVNTIYCYVNNANTNYMTRKLYSTLDLTCVCLYIVQWI